jgi:hypothetical protein
MSLAWGLLGLRVLATLILYTFLGVAFYLIWQELKQTVPQNISSLTTPDHLRIVAAESQTLVGQNLPLRNVTWLGRAPENTIVLDDEVTAARHACLHRENGVWWLEDLGSQHGTWLNEQPLSQPTPLAYGDLIQIGNHQFRLERIEE